MHSTANVSASVGPTDVSPCTLSELITQLEAIDHELSTTAERHADHFSQVHESQRASAANLLQYLQLRQRDLRPLQLLLSSLGLSSLGRSEAHVSDTIRAVLAMLRRLGNEPLESLSAHETSHAFRRLLEQHTDNLLGPPPEHRTVRVMVTMPSEAADNPQLIFELLRHGMDCLRINCAHDDPSAWGQMIAHLRRAEGRLGKKCRVLMDLAGPKLRTGPLPPGPQVLKWHPQRDAMGNVLGPARIWITPENAPELPPSSAEAIIPLQSNWIAMLASGHQLEFFDARGKQRDLTVTQAVGTSRWAESFATTYITTGTKLFGASEHAPKDWPNGTPPRVGKLPEAEPFILLREGDRLILTADSVPGQPATRDSQGRIVTPATISCSLPEAFAFVQEGHPILFDDGRIGGVVRCVDPQRLMVEITRVQPNGSKLRADKGINLPESRLNLPALSAKDRADLEFIAQHADLVGYSFVHSVDDVTELQQLLAARCPTPPGIVLKIELRSAFEQLPLLLLAAMRSPVAGVMIARGDLGVECGFERLAEVQEEILWICEAAHMPVIWATQVLESLAKSGLPSRAEVTDAAMSVRAECVMLNKGPFIIETLQMLDNILRRMEAHQNKKSSTLRPLGVAQAFGARFE